MEIASSRNSGRAIDYVQIIGERNTGTNWVRALLNANLRGVEAGWDLDWKHGFLNMKTLGKHDLDSKVFVFLFRNPWTWLDSMWRNPHHAPQLYNLEFGVFIRSEWACYFGERYRHLAADGVDVADLKEIRRERHPETGQRIANVVELRNLKHADFLDTAAALPNSLHVQYEAVAGDPAGFVRLLAERFEVIVSSEIAVPDGHFGKNSERSFKPGPSADAVRSGVGATDERFILERLDPVLESRLGY